MYTFIVPKMSCGGCVNAISKAISQVDEGAVVEADLPTNTVSVQTASSEESIVKAMCDAGYKPL